MNALTVVEPDLVVLPSSGSLGLALPKGLSFEQWRAIGRELAARERVLHWWIGDWWRFGTRKYGEARAEAEAMATFGGYTMVRNCGWVAEKFQDATRVADLEFTHYREVAALPPAEASALLARAQDENLTTRELRVIALKRKVHLGIVKPRDVDDDWNYKALKGIAAAWNRAERSVREEFAALMAESDFGVIEV